MAGGQRIVLFLVLACFLVYINANVHIKIRYEETSTGFWRTIVFTQDQFEEFQQCLSNRTNQRCDVRYVVQVPYNVEEISPKEGVTNSESYVFQCTNTGSTLQCQRQQADRLDQICNNTQKHHFFRVNNSECFALAWKYDFENFTSSLDTVRDCDGCTEPTTTTTITSTSSTTSATTTTTTTSADASVGTPSIKAPKSLEQPADDEGDNTGMIIGIIAGVLAALLLIIGTIVLYKRKQAKPRVAPLESQPNVNRPPADTRMKSREATANYSDTTPIYIKD